MVDAQDLTVNQKAVLLSLAALPPRFSHDRVYFEKVLFLLAKSDPVDLADIDATFEPWKIGPYNEYVDEVLTGLQDFGVVRGDRMALTPAGEAVAAALSKDPEVVRMRENLSTIVSAIGSFSVDDLLYLVYELYPEFAGKSEVRESARSEKLEHFSVQANKVPEGETISVQSDKGGRLKVRREKDRLLILPSA
jgi:hypothetical protein